MHRCITSLTYEATREVRFLLTSLHHNLYENLRALTYHVLVKSFVESLPFLASSGCPTTLRFVGGQVFSRSLWTLNLNGLLWSYECCDRVDGVHVSCRQDQTSFDLKTLPEFRIYYSAYLIIWQFWQISTFVRPRSTPCFQIRTLAIGSEHLWLILPGLAAPNFQNQFTPCSKIR